MMKILVVGLGNPNKDGTRHNFGIEAVRLFVERMEEQGRLAHQWHEEQQFAAEIASVAVQGYEVICFFPTTFMNDSGRAVAAYVNFLKLPLSQALIVHDELELALGTVDRIPGGSAKGHNGVRSIHQFLNTQDIARLRLGIGRPKEDAAVDEYVLAQFMGEEQLAVMQAKTAAADQILSFAVSATENLNQE